MMRALLGVLLLAPCLVWAQNGPAEPYYHWPEYPPFSPGSWAWPTPGWWEFPPLGQNYRMAQQAAPPQTILVFAPVQAYPSGGANQSSASATAAGAPAAASPRLSAGQSKPQAGSPLYLIALKEGVIRAAVSYRVEGTVVRYMDLDGAPKEVPLERVDRALSAELNRQRRVPFHLPPEE